MGRFTFLIPLVLLALVLKQALQLARMAAVPVAELVPFSKVGDIDVATLLDVALLLLVAFLAGRAAALKSTSLSAAGIG